MKFQNQSLSLQPINAQTLQALCIEFKVDPKGLPKLGKLTEGNYSEYVFMITGFRPCPVCNGPVGRIEEPEREFVIRNFMGRPRVMKIGPFYSRPRCLRFPIHEVISRHSPDLWERDMGPLCEHDYYRTECKPCIAQRCLDSINRTSPVQLAIQ